MKQGIPTLSTEGIITDPGKALLYIFKSFLAADQSQSNHWKGEVISLVHLIKTNKESPEGLRSATEDALNNRLSSYFDDYKVQVNISTATALDISETPAYNLEMAVLVVDEGARFTLSSVLNDAYQEGDNIFGRMVFRN